MMIGGMIGGRKGEEKLRAWIWIEGMKMGMRKRVKEKMGWNQEDVEEEKYVKGN
jgi:hypothetical protein